MWLDMSQLKHVHYVNPRAPTLAEMVAARSAGQERNALAMQTDIEAVLWRPEFPRRDKTDE
jgi:hypothetical protein